MNKKKLIAIIASVVAVVLIATIVLSVTMCGKNKSSKDAIVIMSEELSNNFNPFYATSGADQDVIGMTQVGMLSTDNEGKTVAGDNYPTVVKAYKVEKKDKDGNIITSGEVAETVYTFVLKNGIKFSDGKPLTMNDVLFSMYENLDPVYTGSSTMYSIDIKGLKAYRSQNSTIKDDDDGSESEISENATVYADNRIMYLVSLYQETSQNLPGNEDLSDGNYEVSEADMKEAISNLDVSTIDDGYKLAVAAESEWSTFDFKAQILKDYEYILTTYKEELENDYKAAQDSFDLKAKPYSDWTDLFNNEVFKFLYYEGDITPTYEKVQGRDNKEKITGFSDTESYKALDKDRAINKIYKYNVETNFEGILSYSGTAGTVSTAFAAKAKELLLHGDNGDSDTLEVPNISGIKSLGHNTDTEKVVINGTTYNVAHGKENHNDDGTTKNNTYDVLEITINGVDPKAIYNFGFTVAPAHYYSDQEVNIWENKFGVKWSNATFQSEVIQGGNQTEVPVGAGPYAATNAQNEDNPKGSDFVSSNIVYFKRNNYFQSSFGDAFEVKTEKLRFQVVRSVNAIDKLAKGEVDFITPQFTADNANILEGMKKDGFETLSSWQLGYGYIGINAGKVENLNLRKAIMSAMDVSLALNYYKTGTAKTINWPMSLESWAYPWENKAEGKQKETGTLHDYTRFDADEAKVIKKIEDYMTKAGVSKGDSQLKITFTIAGSSVTEHPVYQVFLKAAELLNTCGWQIEVKPDSQALLKLTNGSLTVWAAAWGSTIDPDMYQVYHKDSTATSVKAWGYPEIIKNRNTRSEEYAIIDELSTVIEQARETDVEEDRIELYEKAMGYVLDLAVELPVYQRQNLYAYNSKTVKGFQTNVNPYTSPLEKVWELELIK